MRGSDQGILHDHFIAAITYHQTRSHHSLPEPLQQNKENVSFYIPPFRDFIVMKRFAGEIILFLWNFFSTFLQLIRLGSLSY